MTLAIMTLAIMTLAIMTLAMTLAIMTLALMSPLCFYNSLPLSCGASQHRPIL